MLFTARGKKCKTQSVSAWVYTASKAWFSFFLRSLLSVFPCCLLKVILYWSVNWQYLSSIIFKKRISSLSVKRVPAFHFNPPKPYKNNEFCLRTKFFQCSVVDLNRNWIFAFFLSFFIHVSFMTSDLSVCGLVSWWITSLFWDIRFKKFQIEL